MSSETTRVGLIVIATGRYVEFVDQLLASAHEHVAGLHRLYVLSDRRPPDDPRIVWLPWGHIGWPYPTLLRYRAIAAHQDILRECDILVYSDVDMRFVASFDMTQIRGIFAVSHPGYVGATPDSLPYERNPASQAYVPVGSGLEYFAGGVQGGRAEIYLDACEQMAARVQEDLNAGIVPVWHDESIWNGWLIDHPPDLVLGSEYCTPETAAGPQSVLLALDKDHARLRGTPWQVRSVERLVRARRALRRRSRAAARVAARAWGRRR
ncbi:MULTISPECIES: hypothetical protein [unclassified Nocardioides]|uniref:hypothetical protein n=1 Tax=unclassified Nocardioides TaxID=2615069 RepID=UPI0009F0546C|nr:uncharacterized protein PD653B2_4262 [Nocardioides sp. PD653-B2]GAW57609.1 uncharacterized protein PD653_5054 [Nocardioides sp. PD653]